MMSKTHHPTRGRCVIKFADPFAEAKASGLALPEMVERRRDSIGVVLSAHNDPNKRVDPISVGDRVLVPPYIAGNKIGDGCEIISIADIVAVVEGEGDVSACAQQEIERCAYCGPANTGSTNGMLMQECGVNGETICPRCNRDRNGIVHSGEIKITDDEREDFRGEVARGER